MLGNYVLHYPLTDFAVGLLVVAALVDLARIAWKRPHWQIAVDLLLVLGFLGAALSVGSGLWLVSAQGHGHTSELSMHHLFAYATLGTSALGVAAHVLVRRRPKLAWVKTASLLLSAALVSGAGFYGGKMAHPGTGAHAHGSTGDSHATPTGSGAKPSDATTTKPPEPKPAQTKPAETGDAHDHKH